MKIEAIAPHGLCGGVNAAIAKALTLKNVYCLHALVHNEIVVDELRALGFKFVERIEDVPEGETVVFAAHGVPPQVREAAAARRLKVVDTTCPFVARAHSAAKRFSDDGLPVVILGDQDHDEVKGIAGEVSTPPPRPGDEIGVVSQTTMNSDDVAKRIEELRRTYVVKGASDVCKATKERQDAVRDFCAGHSECAPGSLGVLVLGSATSANSGRLAEIAEECGAKAFRAGSMSELAAIDFGGVETLGVTSGASTPERFFDEAMKFLRHVPRHVAIIMDGNGRWATRRGKHRGAGHVAGADTLGRVLEWCGARGIQYLTVYAFSTENWKRPKDEVDGLMRLFARMLKSKEGEFMRQKVRFRMIGRRGDLPKSLLSVITRLEDRTRSFAREFIVAISYGGRAEIVDAVNAARSAGEPLTEETFRRYLYAPDVPDPDLVIRTSGEIRTSNFLVWETAYSEYHFTDVLWPDFSERDFDLALEDYASRTRRRGGL